MNIEVEHPSGCENVDLPPRLQKVREVLEVVMESASDCPEEQRLIVEAIEALLTKAWVYRDQWSSYSAKLPHPSGAESLLSLAAHIGRREVPGVAGACRSVLGKMLWARCLNEHGGTYSAEEAARQIGTTADEIGQRYRARQLIGVNEDGEVRYPVFQFAEGHVLPHLTEVLALIESADPVAYVRFLLSFDPDLNMAPLEALRNGLHLDLIRRKAAQVGQQVAR